MLVAHLAMRAPRRRAGYLGKTSYNTVLDHSRALLPLPPPPQLNEFFRNQRELPS